MTEHESNTALIPAVKDSVGASQGNEEEFVASAPDSANEADKRLPASSILRGFFVSFFSAFAAVAFGNCTFAALSALDMGEYYLIRLMLGEYFGGVGNVEAIPKELYQADYLSPKPDTHLPEDKLNPIQGAKPKDDLNSSSIRLTLSSDDFALTNETPYEPDTKSLLTSDRVIPLADELYSQFGSEAPLVLILHTHGTEGYSESENSDYRTTDTSKNVVSCGTVIAEILEDRGIHTIHLTEMFDEDDFTMAYYSASLAIKRITDQFPSISYIIDVHRDSVLADGSQVSPVTKKDGNYTAQMMLVIGTDHGGSGHSTWENNLSLALRLQSSLNQETPQLMRNINLRSASFNEQFSDGSLLLEIGACGSSLEEAHSSAAIFADAIADEILGKQ